MDLWDIVENGYNEPKVKPTIISKDPIEEQSTKGRCSSFKNPTRCLRLNLSKNHESNKSEGGLGHSSTRISRRCAGQPTQERHSDHMDSKLYNAVMEGNINILKLNEEHVNFQLTSNKNTVLHIAALFGQTECVEEILKMNSSLLCQTNVKGGTALHLAAREGQQDSIDALIKCAKNLDAEGSVELESGSTMTKKMLRARNEDGDTALHDAVRLLAEDPEYTYTANNAGETPLYIAAKRRHHQVVSRILKTCTTPAYDGPGCRTALHTTIISNDED
ncbi:unnamed protein product [Camellia sinensis]